jgi:transcriptional regulator with XRE-family HTH domain
VSGREWYAVPTRPLSLGARKLRLALLGGLTQEELGLRIGCCQEMVSAMAHGRKKPRSYELVKALERELAINAGDWYALDV